MDLFDFETRWYRVLTRALVPAGVLGGSGDHLDPGELFRDECRAGPWYSVLVIRLALWVVWFSPVFLGMGLHLFGGLDAEARAEALERLLKSPRFLVRVPLGFLKIECCTLVLGDRRVMAYLGAYGVEPAAPSPAV